MGPHRGRRLTDPADPAPPAGEVKGYLHRMRELGTGMHPADILAGVALGLADHSRATLPAPLPTLFGSSAPLTVRPPATSFAPPLTAGPDLLGAVHEVLLADGHRHRRGVHYTPRAVAEGVVAEALAGWDQPAAPTVCDPTVGGGAFLLAAARALDAQGLDRRRIVTDLLWGADLDPLAVSVTEATLWLWSGEDGPPVLAPHLVVADSLGACRGLWPDAPSAGFDLVVGNPPFGAQRIRRTARNPVETVQLRQALGPAVGGYADTAALFLLTAANLVADGGRVALVQPESFLAARDAAPVRDALVARSDLVGLWLADGSLFVAEVEVCAPIFEVPGVGGDLRRGEVRRTVGGGFSPLAAATVAPDGLGGAPSWSPLAAAARGVPEIGGWSTAGLLGERWQATAGFRDQYYGLVDHVVEAADADTDRRTAPLLTTGLVEPLAHRWGRHPARFAKRRWTAPVVDLDSLGAANAALARWVADRLVAKVLVATQTLVVEAVVDDAGALVPSVPLVAVTATDRHDALAPWLAAAALSAPPVTAWALIHYGGAGLTGGVVKLAARQLLAVPLPAKVDPWYEVARRWRALAATDLPAEQWRAVLDDAGAELCAAYGLDGDHPVLAWWRARLH